MVRAAYKCKDKKVNPVDVVLPDGMSPEGGTFAQEGAEAREAPQHAGKTVPRGAN